MMRFAQLRGAQFYQCGVFVMPKLKTNRGAAKRFRRTANGYKHRRAYKNHILTKKGPKRKRRLRGLGPCSPSDVGLLDRMLPKKAR
jgi:large subunit ribosomal protein L35